MLQADMVTVWRLMPGSVRAFDLALKLMHWKGNIGVAHTNWDAKTAVTQCIQMAQLSQLDPVPGETAEEKCSREVFAKVRSCTSWTICCSATLPCNDNEYLFYYFVSVSEYGQPVDLSAMH